VKINGDALKAIRTREAMSVTELARLSGVDRTVITRVEAGTRRGTLVQLAALAEALRVPRRAITLYDEIDVDGDAA
jgi:transcriptional regulator with XRE-family HTH domain